MADESSTHELHFTHRTSHGESGDADEDKGKFSKLANDTLSRLQQKYPEVFAEPKYPVSREGCAVDIRHEIRLKDADSAPPKRRIYPLDNQELEELKKQL